MIIANKRGLSVVSKIKNKLASFLKKRFSRTIYVFGDSHAEVFYTVNDDFTPFLTQFDVSSVGGATAQGLRNPNSKTDALKTFKEKILSISNKKRKAIFLLGEVDTGFVIWYRSQKYNEPVEIQLQNSISTFFEFLNWTKSVGMNDIYVLSVPLPTIKDGQNFGDVANSRKEIKASQLERTQLTLRYNRMLKENADELGYKFISTDQYLLNDNTGLIRDEFMNKDKTNHHLDDNEYSKVICQELYKQEVLRK